MALITGEDYRLYRVKVHVAPDPNADWDEYSAKEQVSYLGPYNNISPAKGMITREKAYKRRWKQYGD